MTSVEHAEALMRTGAYDEAKSILSELISDDPGDLRAICDIGIAFTETGENEKAIRALTHYMERDTDNPYAWEALGCARFRTGNFAEARGCLVRSLDLKPDNPSALRNLGILHGMEGRPEEGIRLLERSRLLAPTDYRTIYALAFAVAETDSRDRTRRLMEELLELSLPDDIRKDTVLYLIRLDLGWS